VPVALFGHDSPIISIVSNAEGVDGYLFWGELRGFSDIKKEL